MRSGGPGFSLATSKVKWNCSEIHPVVSSISVDGEPTASLGPCPNVYFISMIYFSWFLTRISHILTSIHCFLSFQVHLWEELGFILSAAPMGWLKTAADLPMVFLSEDWRYPAPSAHLARCVPQFLLTLQTFHWPCYSFLDIEVFGKILNVWCGYSAANA